EIGLYAGGNIEGAAVEERPAAMRALDATQINADLALELGIHRLAAVMAHQHIFGRDRRIGFKFEAEMAVCLAVRQNALGRRGDAAVELVERNATEIAQRRRVVHRVHLTRPRRRPSALFRGSPAPRHCRSALRLPCRPAGPLPSSRRRGTDCRTAFWA